MPPRQGKDEIERGYETPDPWNYQTTPADLERKRLIVGICRLFAPQGLFTNALDIACGEGWITGALPAHRLYGYELSALARSRFPVNVREFGLSQPPHGFPHIGFDLVTCMGALYGHYDWEPMAELIKTQATDVIVTSGICDWELPIDLETVFDAKQVFEAEFPYPRPEANYVQRVRVFRK